MRSSRPCFAARGLVRRFVLLGDRSDEALLWSLTRASTTHVVLGRPRGVCCARGVERSASGPRSRGSGAASRTPRPGFTIELFAHPSDLALDPEEHLLVAISSRSAGKGYTEEVRDLRTRRGVLIGRRRQLLALL